MINLHWMSVSNLLLIQSCDQYLNACCVGFKHEILPYSWHIWYLDQFYGSQLESMGFSKYWHFLLSSSSSKGTNSMNYFECLSLPVPMRHRSQQVLYIAMIFTIKMHCKWFYYKNALQMIFTIKMHCKWLLL